MSSTGLVLAVLVVSATAIASPESDAADRLLGEGVELASRNELRAACERFAAARVLRDDIRAVGLESGCYEKVGRVAAAAVGYRHLRALADDADDPSSAAFAAAGLARLAARIPRLVLTVASRAPGPAVIIDGRRFPSAQWDQAVTLDPGEHVLRVEGAGALAVTERFSLREGEVVERWIDREARSSRRTWRWYTGLGALAGGGSLTAVGTAFGIAAIRSWHAARDAGCDGAGRCATDDARALLDEAHGRATASTWLVVGGLTVAAVGAFMWWTAPRSRAGAWTWSIAPNATGTGVAMIGGSP